MSNVPDPKDLVPQPPTDTEFQCRVEALKQIREWSSGLISIQTAGVAAIGLWLQREAGDWSFWWSVLALFTLLASILIGAVFLGSTIPYAIAHVPYRRRDESDIFHYIGGRGKYSIGTWVKLQSILFFVSLVAFVFSAATAVKKESVPIMVNADPRATAVTAHAH
jgi:hypothetical protein